MSLTKSTSKSGWSRKFIQLATISIAVALVSTGCAAEIAPQGTEQSDTLQIGVFKVAQATILDDIVDGFKEGLESSIGDDVTVEYHEQNANADQGLIGNIARDFAGSDYDAFAVVGTQAVIALAQQVTDRAVFALAMGDPVGAGVAESLEVPGGNLTGSIDYVAGELLLSQLKELDPSIENLGTVFDPSNQNADIWVKGLREAASGAGITLVESTITQAGDVNGAARSLDGRVDAILIGPDTTIIAGIAAVAAVAASAGIPLLFGGGGEATTPGVLGSIGANYFALGVGAGENAAKVFAGASPADTPFFTPEGTELVLNQQTVDEMNFDIPSSVLDSAIIVG